MAAWPPAYSSAFLAQGVTTIRWGTDGIMANTSPNGSGGGYNGYYIVESIRGNDEIENIYIEQGTGLKATRIQLWQGRRYVLTVVDDTGMTAPAPATLISLVDTVGAGASTYQFRVVENGYNAARKVEGKREITAEYLTCIEGAGTPPEA
jgi:hypothetical protein